MTANIERSRTPEERELEKKRAQLVTLQAELAQYELGLATHHAELRRFEAEYLRIVGKRLADLDRLQAEIAEAKARRDPSDLKLRDKAAEVRAKAQESAESASSAEVAERLTAFTPSESLKRLYRDLAKVMHPDLAVDEADRKKRTALMAEVNLAYEEGNEERLKSILRDWRDSPEAVQGEGTAAELVRVIRKIAQIEQRMGAIAVEISHLMASELHQLKSRVENARQGGKDLLLEMAAQVDIEIEAAHRYLGTLIGGGTIG